MRQLILIFLAITAGGFLLRLYFKRCLLREAIPVRTKTDCVLLAVPIGFSAIGCIIFQAYLEEMLIVLMLTLIVVLPWIWVKMVVSPLTSERQIVVSAKIALAVLALAVVALAFSSVPTLSSSSTEIKRRSAKGILALFVAGIAVFTFRRIRRQLSNTTSFRAGLNQ